MILVFFKCFIITVIVVIAILILLILSSRIEVKLDNFYIENANKKNNNKNFLVKISLKIFNIRWLKINIDKNKLASEYVKEKLKVEKKNINVNKEITNIFAICKNNKSIKKEFNKMKLRLEKLNLNINIGVEDCVLTSYIVGIIAIIMSNIVPHIIDKKIKNSEIIKKYKYQIVPIYMNKNLYKINLNCIIGAKLVHIIYIIFLIKKEERRRSDKNERTSNRKSYEYSYE